MGLADWIIDDICLVFTRLSHLVDYDTSLSSSIEISVTPKRAKPPPKPPKDEDYLVDCIFCLYPTQVLNSDLQEHIDVEHMDQLFICKVCQDDKETEPVGMFATLEATLRHLAEHHHVMNEGALNMIKYPEDKFLTVIQCQICQKRWFGSTREQFHEKHLVPVHQKYTIQQGVLFECCRLCEFEANSSNDIYRHLNEVHSKNVSAPTAKHLVIPPAPKISPLVEPMDLHPRAKKFFEEFTLAKAVKFGQASNNVPNSPIKIVNTKCLGCGVRLESTRSDKTEHDHIRRDHKYKKAKIRFEYTCETCGLERSFKTKVDALQHCEHHVSAKSNEVLKCSYCQSAKTFKTQTSLAQHQKNCKMTSRARLLRMDRNDEQDRKTKRTNKSPEPMFRFKDKEGPHKRFRNESPTPPPPANEQFKWRKQICRFCLEELPDDFVRLMHVGKRHADTSFRCCQCRDQALFLNAEDLKNHFLKTHNRLINMTEMRLNEVNKYKIRFPQDLRCLHCYCCRLDFHAVGIHDLKAHFDKKHPGIFDPSYLDYKCRICMKAGIFDNLEELEQHLATHF